MKKILISLLISFLLTGCVSVKKANTPAPIPSDGGFYALGRDKDGNFSWSQNVYLATSNAQKPNFKDTDVLVITKDPEDEKAFYVGTKSNGLYYTYDAGKNWFAPEGFKNDKINAISVSYNNKCQIYLATEADLYGSNDCSRSWLQLSHETRDGFFISALATDPINEGALFMGLSIMKNRSNKQGSDIVKSVDFGKSWQVVYRTPNGSIVNKIIVNQSDSKIVYAATDNNGLFKTTDGGIVWENINGEPQVLPRNKQEQADFVPRLEKLIDFAKDTKSKQIRDSLVFRDLVLIPNEPDSLIHASNYGLLKSSDGGNSWQEIKLIPAQGEKKAIIYSLAINAQNSQEFYYGTDDTLFKTMDGGENWTTIQGPGTRAIYQIITTPNQNGDSNVYVGMYNLKAPATKKK